MATTWRTVACAARARIPCSFSCQKGYVPPTDRKAPSRYTNEFTHEGALSPPAETSNRKFSTLIAATGLGNAASSPPDFGGTGSSDVSIFTVTPALGAQFPEIHFMCDWNPSRLLL